MLVSQPTLYLAAAAVLLSPYLPLLFMGEEYGADTPFYFFSDYQEPATTRNLLEGRKQQFATFQWDGDVRDPQDEACFRQSKLHWEDRGKDTHKKLLEWHRLLIQLRKKHPLLTDLSKNRLRADVIGEKCLSVYRYSEDLTIHLLCLFNFSHNDLLSIDIGYAGATPKIREEDTAPNTSKKIREEDTAPNTPKKNREENATPKTPETREENPAEKIREENPARKTPEEKQPVWRSLLASPNLPASIPYRGTLELPPQAVAVYELNLSPVSAVPAAG